MPLLLRSLPFFLSFLLPGSAIALTVSVAPITFVGDAAPGMPGRTFSSALGDVNDDGQVAFTGGLAGGGQGIWTWEVDAGGAPTPLLVPGPAPFGPAGAEVSNVFVREITSSGLVGWEGSLRTGVGGVTSANDRIVGQSESAGHTLVAREGDPAPGLPGLTLALGVSPDAIPDWNGAGQMVQTIPSFTPPFNIYNTLYRFEPGVGLSPIYVTNDPVPGDPGRFITGGVINSVNEAGQVAFAAGTTTTPGSGTPDATIFGPDGAGGFALMARVNGEAPDTPAGTTFRSFPGGGFSSLNEHGQLAFAADLVVGPGGVTTADNSGIWVADGPADITLRYREGDAIPGSPGLFFGLQQRTPVINDAGDLVISTQLALGGGVTTLDDAVLLVPDGAGDVMLLARERDANPFLPGEVWGGFFSLLAFADDGALLFHAPNGSGLDRFYYRDASGGVSLVTGRGMNVDLGGGDVRTINTFIDFQGSDDATRLLATTRFTDGSTGLVLFSVPEPGTALLVGAGVLGLARRRS